MVNTIMASDVLHLGLTETNPRFLAVEFLDTWLDNAGSAVLGLGLSPPLLLEPIIPPFVTVGFGSSIYTLLLQDEYGELQLGGVDPGVVTNASIVWTPVVPSVCFH